MDFICLNIKPSFTQMSSSVLASINHPVEPCRSSMEQIIFLQQIGRMK